MINPTKKMSTFRAALHLYDFRRYQAFVYLVVLTVGTVVALILDLGFGVPQGKVLVYLVPVMTLLFLGATLVCVAVRRAAFGHSAVLARSTSRLLQKDFGVHSPADKTLEQITGTLPELQEIRDQVIEELLREVRALTEQVAPTKRYNPTRRYSPTGRPFRFTRRNPEGYRRA